MNSLEKEEAEEKIRVEAQSRYDKIRDHSVKALEDYSASKRLDIEQLRNFIIQIAIISFGAVGFSLPILNSLNLVKNPVVFICGLFLLALSAILGLWYAALRIENSIIGSHKSYRAHRKDIKKFLDLQLFLLKNPTKYDEYYSILQQEISQQSKSIEEDIKKDEPKREKFMYFLISLLSAGIILIFLSLFRVAITI